MTRPTVVVLCVHGETKRHWVNPGGVRTGYAVWDGSPWQCSGGRVLEGANMNVRAACEHGRYDAHTWGGPPVDPDWDDFPDQNNSCPGGRVLEQAIIWWCDNHDDFMRENDDLCSKAIWSNKCLKVERVLLDALASAQENQP